MNNHNLPEENTINFVIWGDRSKNNKPLKIINGAD